MIVVPMLLLYASAVAVTGWAHIETMDALAARVLTHLLGPLFFLLRPREVDEAAVDVHA